MGMRFTFKMKKNKKKRKEKLIIRSSSGDVTRKVFGDEGDFRFEYLGNQSKAEVRSWCLVGASAVDCLQDNDVFLFFYFFNI